MKENLSQLEQILVDMINETKEGISKGLDITIAQMPDLVYQLLLYKVAYYCLTLVVCLILTITFVKLQKKIKVSVKPKPRYPYDKLNEDSYTLFVVMGGFLMVVMPAIVSYYSICNLLKIWLAPKIYLIEYVSHLVR